MSNVLLTQNFNQNRLAVRNGKKSPNQETGFWEQGTSEGSECYQIDPK